MPEYSYCCGSCTHKWSIFSSFAKYKEKRKCPRCKKIKDVHRDYSEDNVHGSVTLSLSEVKTLGHYADKQTKQYGKWKCEDMANDFKTKKVESGRELPAGMSRMEKPDEAPIWPGSDQKKRKSRRKNK